MIFFHGETNVLYNGRNCDPHNQCDPYIRIHCNDDENYATHWIWDTASPHFNARYVSPVMSNASECHIELIDRDNGYDDQLMERWMFKYVSQLVGEKRLEGNQWFKQRANKIFITANWISEPADHE